MPPPQFTSHSHVPPQLYPQEWGNPNCPMPPMIPHSHVPPPLPMPPVIPCPAPRQQSPTPTPTLLPMAGKGDSLAIRIDSDTTCFLVSVWQHHRVEIITTDQRNRTTPSHVAFTERLIGDATKDQVTINPVNTIFDVDASIRSDMQLWPSKAIPGPPDKPTIVVNYKGKSSVLESLAGINLPRGQGICTKAPLDIRLWNHLLPTPELVLEFYGKIFSTDEAHVSQAINAAIEKLAGQGISTNPLTLLVKKSGVPDLYLVDLLGIT
ncbi:heat shock cognate 70 kDa protein-like [Glycine max]|uniref:heat shock cognate 70 kDa protein-like n=1 Tax=Glycine max TaxID=3847 RepID=UPI001B354CCA|nr:heat shock cognate 70 kDa protein-like [Glycine max]